MILLGGCHYLLGGGGYFIWGGGSLLFEHHFGEGHYFVNCIN